MGNAVVCKRAVLQIGAGDPAAGGGNGVTTDRQVIDRIISGRHFAGGLAAGTLINKSGAAEALGEYISKLDMKGGFVTVFIILTVTLLMSDVTSNTATAAVAMPLVISITQGCGLNPIPYVYVASVGVNLSYMLPTSIRAIPVGYGLSPKYMFKEGWKITVLIIVIMSIVCALLLKYWPAFSTV